MTARFLMLLLLGLACSASEAAAQKRPSLQIVLEEVSESGRKCGISKDQLRATATLSLRNSRISIVESTNPYFYVNVNVLYSEKMASCIYNARVQIVYAESASLYGEFKRRTTYCTPSASMRQNWGID